MNEIDIQRHGFEGETLEELSPILSPRNTVFEFSLTPKFSHESKKSSMIDNYGKTPHDDEKTPEDKIPLDIPIRPKKSKPSKNTQSGKSRKSLHMASASAPLLSEPRKNDGFPSACLFPPSYSEAIATDNNHLCETSDDNGSKKLKQEPKPQNLNIPSDQQTDALSSDFFKQELTDIDIFITSPPSSDGPSKEDEGSPSSIMSGVSYLKLSPVSLRDLQLKNVSSQSDLRVNENDNTVCTSTPLLQYMDLDFEEISSVSDARSDSSAPFWFGKKSSIVCSSELDFSDDMHRLEVNGNGLVSSGEFSGSDKENIDPGSNMKFRHYVYQKIGSLPSWQSGVFKRKWDFESISLSQPCQADCVDNMGDDIEKRIKLDCGLDKEDDFDDPMEASGNINAFGTFLVEGRSTSNEF